MVFPLGDGAVAETPWLQAVGPESLLPFVLFVLPFVNRSSQAALNTSAFMEESREWYPTLPEKHWDRHRLWLPCQPWSSALGPQPWSSARHTRINSKVGGHDQPRLLRSSLSRQL